MLVNNHRWRTRGETAIELGTIPFWLTLLDKAQRPDVIRRLDVTARHRVVNLSGTKCNQYIWMDMVLPGQYASCLYHSSLSVSFF